MASRSRHPEPKIVRPDDVDPRTAGTAAAGAGPHAGRFRGARRFPQAARVSPRARARRARQLRSRRAALVDQHNIRYTTSTVIGEWARDKLTRYSLLTGNGEPYIWDFGSAARHHKLYAPWLHTDHCAPDCSACGARPEPI